MHVRTLRSATEQGAHGGVGNLLGVATEPILGYRWFSAAIRELDVEQLTWSHVHEDAAELGEAPWYRHYSREALNL